MAPSERARQVLAAARTDPAVACLLDRWYRGGEEGLFQSPGLAFRWDLRAAEGGHLVAQCKVGCAYDVGVGVEVGYEVAATWLTQAVERGDRSAQYNLGLSLG